MHGNGQSSRDGNGRAFEAHPFSQRESPVRNVLSAELRVRITVSVVR